jgi:2-aminoadipate transaminase
VVVTTGSQQGIDLMARATLDPGDVVALADPGYIGAVQAFRLAGARLHGVPCDDGGLDVDALAAALRRGLRPTLVYVVPSFSNPTGGTLTADRAVALAALADRHGFLIVEDDPYAALRWAGTAPPPLARLTSRVVTLRTISKVLAPGLRVAYAVAPPAVADDLTLLKQAVDLHTSTPLQRAVLRLVTEPGFLEGHLAAIRPLYEARADALFEALDAELPGRVLATRPDGGMFVWCELDDVDTETLLPEAIRHGVAFVPGPAFAVEAGTHRHALRLSFASVTPGELVEGVRRLRTALDAARVVPQRA